MKRKHDPTNPGRIPRQKTSVQRRTRDDQKDRKKTRKLWRPKASVFQGRNRQQYQYLQKTKRMISKKFNRFVKLEMKVVKAVSMQGVGVEVSLN